MPAASAVGADAVRVFPVGARTCTVDDVLAAAGCLGDLERFRTEWRRRNRAAAAAQAAGLVPPPTAVDQALDEFRYARDLVSGEECERWLADRGQTFADRVESLTQRLQSTLATAGTEAEAAAPPSAESGLGRDAVLSEDFDRWAHQLARRLAALQEGGGELPPGATVASQWPALQAAYAAAAAAAVNPDQRRRALATQRLDLLFVQFELAEFDSLAAAREAMLCAREDGAPLREVAAGNGFPCQTVEAFIRDLPQAWGELLNSAVPGAVVDPRAQNGDHVVLSLVTRREPRLEDPRVLQRLDFDLRERHFR